MRQSTKNLLQLLAQNANASFSDAKSLPPATYHSSRILKLEREHLFRKEWICIGRTAEIPDQGDFLCRDIVDAPVFVVRQRDDSVKAFAHVCVHRSSRLLSGAGHVSRISCPYHSWTYELEVPRRKLHGCLSPASRPQEIVRQIRIFRRPNSSVPG